jgi:hypothetical protein
LDQFDLDQFDLDQFDLDQFDLDQFDLDQFDLDQTPQAVFPLVMIEADPLSLRPDPSPSLPAQRGQRRSSASLSGLLSFAAFGCKSGDLDADRTSAEDVDQGPAIVLWRKSF